MILTKSRFFFSDISSLNCRQTLEPAVYPTSPLPHSSTDMVFTAEESISVIFNLATLRFRSNSFGRVQAYTTSRLSNVIFRPGKCEFRPNDIVGFVRKTNAIHCHRRSSTCNTGISRHTGLLEFRRPVLQIDK